MFQQILFGGNVSDYRNKIKSISGVGEVVVVTASNLTNWDPGKFFIVITSSDYKTPASELVANVQEIIDLRKMEAELDLHQFGHKVEIRGANSQEVNIKVELVLKEGSNLEDVKEKIMRGIDSYYTDTIKESYETNNIILRIAKCINIVLNVEEVIDVTSLKFCITDASGLEIERDGNVEITGYDIPTLSEVIINEHN